jgi:hypothetical protein
MDESVHKIVNYLNEAREQRIIRSRKISVGIDAIEDKAHVCTSPTSAIYTQGTLGQNS